MAIIYPLFYCIMYFNSNREKPLAFYVFSASGSTFREINRRTSAGGVIQNDVFIHASGSLVI